MSAKCLYGLVDEVQLMTVVSFVLCGLLSTVDHGYLDICEGGYRCGNAAEQFTNRYLGRIYSSRICERCMVTHRNPVLC